MPIDKIHVQENPRCNEPSMRNKSYGCQLYTDIYNDTKCHTEIFSTLFKLCKYFRNIHDLKLTVHKNRNPQSGASTGLM